MDFRDDENCKDWGKGKRCNCCGNPTWECICIPDNMSLD